MIRTLHNKTLQNKRLQVIFVFIVFFCINYLLFLSFMNVCFQNLVPGQPVYITGICIVFLLVDLIFCVFKSRIIINISNLLDLIIIICLSLSFSLYRQYKFLVYLQIIVVLKISDLFLINQMVYELVKMYNNVFKTYVVVKIVYWILLVGHIFGCLFYALDIYLIQHQYFGTLSQNPALYYQGQLHAFTPIFELQQQWRYVYAVYYGFSLLSTVAFGDIVGHNYYEDVMVSVFLIISTITISLIIEQMFIVFRRQKTRYYQLITNIKHASQFIRSQQDISDQFRYDIINYMISSQWRQITQIPKLDLLTVKLQQSIFQQSILSKSDDNLPYLIKQYYLPLLKVKYYPVNYFIVDYNKLDNHIFGTIILHAKLYLGYSKNIIGNIDSLLLGSKYIKKQCISYGFNQLIANNNYLNRYLTVQLVQQTQVFVLSDDQFQVKLRQSKNYQNQYLPTPLEYYQSSKDDIIFNSQERLQCISCSQKGHTLVNCPKYHYYPNQQQKRSIYSKRYYHNRKFKPRRKVQSKKNQSFKSLVDMQNQINNNPINYLKIVNELFNKNNYVQNILNKTIQKTMANYKQNTHDYQVNQFQSYFKWKIYSPQGMLQN